MIATARRWLQQKLSPGTFQSIRFYWWHCSDYLPRFLASVFVRRAPQVQGFPGAQTAGSLVEQLSAVNVLAPTGMCHVMTRHGSDKGRDWHNYTTVYSALFGKLRDRPLRIFELGLGSNDPQYAATMGGNGRAGGSLRGWRELFPRALVFGADIDRQVLFEEERIQTFYCDQLDGEAIRHLWSQPALQGGMDILIDDGMHTFESNTSFLNGSLQQLRPGGVYVVEDILQETLERWRIQLETIYSAQFPDYEFVLVALPNPNNHSDNNLLIVRRRS